MADDGDRIDAGVGSLPWPWMASTWLCGGQRASAGAGAGAGVVSVRVRIVVVTATDSG